MKMKSGQRNVRLGAENTKAAISKLISTSYRTGINKPIITTRALVKEKEIKGRVLK